MTNIKTLKDCPVFATLSSAELEKVAGMAVAKQYNAGVTIFKGQSRPEELIVLEDGRVALQIDMPMTPPQPPKKVTVDIVGKNEMLGWSTFVEPDAYILTAVCLNNTKETLQHALISGKVNLYYTVFNINMWIGNSIKILHIPGKLSMIIHF